MKKSEIYKYALLAVVQRLAAQNAACPKSGDEVYEMLSSLCERIDIELLSEASGGGSRH